MAAIFALMIVAEMVRGSAVRITPGIVVAALSVSLAATASNLVALKRGADELATLAPPSRGALGALELTRDTVDPGLILRPGNANNFYADIIDAGTYLDAVDTYGSPAYTAAELTTASEPGRIAADKVFNAALRPELEPARGVTPGGSAPAVVGPEGAVVATRGACVDVRAADGFGPVLTVPPEGMLLRARTGADEAALRRYSTGEFPVDLGPIGTGPQLLRITPDLSPQPWQLQLDPATRAVTACGVEGS
jgi:hypothetical protein